MILEENILDEFAPNDCQKIAGRESSERFIRDSERRRDEINEACVINEFSLSGEETEFDRLIEKRAESCKMEQYVQSRIVQWRNTNCVEVMTTPIGYEFYNDDWRSPYNNVVDIPSFSIYRQNSPDQMVEPIHNQINRVHNQIPIHNLSNQMSFPVYSQISNRMVVPAYNHNNYQNLLPINQSLLPKNNLNLLPKTNLNVLPRNNLNLLSRNSSNLLPSNQNSSNQKIQPRQNHQIQPHQNHHITQPISMDNLTVQVGVAKRRSRHGCTNCRKRRRKCDERKPSCGLCQKYHQTCNYCTIANTNL